MARFCILFLFACLGAGCVHRGPQTLQSFRVEGTLDGDFDGRLYAHSFKDLQFVYGYKEGAWMIEKGELLMVDGRRSLPGNIRSIPGGVRSVYFAPAATKSAALNGAKATPFESPGTEENAFAIWLACTPNPKLPISEGNRIEWPLENVFGIPWSPQMRSTNFASIRWETNAAGYVRKLTVINDGWLHAINGTRTPASGRFANGFEQLEYEVTRWARHGRVSLPSEARLRWYSPSSELELISEKIVKVRAFEFTADPFARGFLVPARVFAEDYRLLPLSEGQPVGYIVENDAWPAPTDRELVSRARATKRGIAK